MTALALCSLSAQNTVVKGRVVDINSNEPIAQSTIQIEGDQQVITTNSDGQFLFSEKILLRGEQVLLVQSTDYISQRIPIRIQEGETINLDPILLQLDLTEVESQIGIISLSDSELNQDDGTVFNISGLLQASKDVFLNAAAFDFSATFFKPRGLDNANGKVLINGLEMNKLFNGRPQWGDWGGLNDAQRNREFSMGLSPSDYTFGDIAGTSNMVMRASHYRRGGRFSVAAANRSYQGRIMATYHSGVALSGWAYSLSLSRRFGEAGYVDGTGYDANSFFVSVEKKLSNQHSINLTGFYTPNRRGRSTALTKEMRNLKGIRYNPNWGFQNGKARNSRVREIEEPVILLNHYWDISEKTLLNINLGYQFGTIKNSRIDNNGTRIVETVDGQSFFAGGARNPLGNYYQRLPSYFLRNEDPRAYDYQLAYLAQQEFVANGQLNWEALYDSNIDFEGNSQLATYVIQNDVTEDTQIWANAIFDTQLNEVLRLNGTVSYRGLTSENYAEVSDLLGSSGYLDIDSFTEAASGEGAAELQTNRAQSDLQHPNRIAGLGERYKYNYEIRAQQISGFGQVQGKLPTVDFYVAATAGQTSYQRTGLFENGNFPGNRSLGDSELLNFSTYGVKGGAVYKVTGRHLIDLNAGYLTKAPNFGKVFTNSRQNNDIIIGEALEKVTSADLSYRYRSPIVKARLTGYYNQFQDQSELGFYFTQDISGLGVEGDAFVQEIMTGIATRSVGIELGLEAQMTPTFKLKAAGSFGQNTYTNDPNVYLTSDDFESPLTFGDGTAKLKNYHIAGGPERAYQLGFEYRDPYFWWLGVTANYFSHAFIDVNNLARTANFSSDFDGQPFNDYDEELARELLQQQQFDPYVLLNVVGGKSWRIGKYFVGFFATVNNALDQHYMTGGFEQGRNTNFRRLREDKARENGPLFGNRFFFGTGTTYYVNVYVRF